MKRSHWLIVVLCLGFLSLVVRFVILGLVVHKSAVKSDAQKHATRAAAAYDRRDYREALTEYNAAIRLDPNRYILYRFRGLTEWYLGDFTVAKADLDQAISLKPTDSSNFSVRAEILMSLERFEEATKDANTAVSLSPSKAYPYLVRALIKLWQNDPDGAEEDAQKALQLKAGIYPNALSILTRAKLWKQDYDGALADANEIVRISPKDASSYFDRARVEWETGDFPAAIMDDSHAIALQPKNASTYLDRSYLQLTLNEPEKARADIEKALQLDKPYDAYVYLGSLERYLGNLDKALTAYDKAIRHSASRSQAHRGRGFTLYLAGKDKEAIRELQLGLKGARTLTNSHLHLWLLYSHYPERAADAAALLKLPVNSCIPDQWYGDIASCLAGHKSPSELLNAPPHRNARWQEQRLNTDYLFLGVKLAREGDKAGAAEYFKKCIDTPDIDHEAVSAAKLELARLSTSE